MTPESKPPFLEPPPESTAFDYAVQAAKVGAIVFPFLGPGVALFDLITGPARGQRIGEWCEALRMVVNDMSRKVEGLTPESLAASEAFISAFAQATQAALRTHQKEKLEALRNAVVNVALGKEPDPNRQQQFLFLIDRFSETHLTVLRFFKDPAGYFVSRGKPVPLIQLNTKILAYQMLIDAIPELGQQAKSTSADRTYASFQFIELILADLVSAKLIHLERVNETWSIPKFDQNPVPSPVKQLATHLGEDFLAFIAEPTKGKSA